LENNEENNEENNNKNNDKNNNNNKEDIVAAPPKIPKATLIEIFNQVTLQMEKVILRISQLEQSVMQQAKEEGQQVNAEEFKEHMMNEFKSAMKEAEERVYAHYKVTDKEVEVAADYFDDDADFQVALKTLKRKYALFTGSGGEDVPDFVTQKLVTDVMTETMMRMTTSMEEVFAQTKESFEPGTEAFNNMLQQKYVERVGIIRAKVQKKYNLDQDLLQAGVIKYQSDPLFQQKMYELTQHQHERFEKLGL